MSDSLDRLYQAVLAAQHADPATSRTARLLRAGRGKMAKKLAEEAVEVVIDAMHGHTDAVDQGKRRSALQSGGALGRGRGRSRTTSGPRWSGASACSGSPRSCRRADGAGLRGARSWRSTAPRAQAALIAPSRRARPKVADLRAGSQIKPDSARSVRHRAIVREVWRRAHGQCPASPLSKPAMLRRLYDWCIAAAGKPHASWIMGIRVVRGKLVLSGPARRDADPDVAGAAGPGLFLRRRCAR